MLNTYKYIHIYISNWNKTQPRLKCYYKFISTKNIIFASSDGIHAYFGDKISKYGLQCIYIYIYIYVCVCVWVWLDNSLSFKPVYLDNKDTFCQYNFI